MQGTVVEASDYCMKDEEFIEFGTLPSVSGTSDKFAIALAEQNCLVDVKESLPALFLNYKNTLERLVQSDLRELITMDASSEIW